MPKIDFIKKSSLLPSAFGSFYIKIASSLLLFLNGILLGRFLGAKGFGIYAMLMTAVSIASTISMLGIPSLAVREVAIMHCKGQIAQLQKWIRRAFSLVFGSSAGLGLALSVLIFIFFPSAPEKFLPWLVGLIVPITALNFLRAEVIRGYKHVVLADIPEQIIRPFVMLSCITLLFLLHKNIKTEIAVFSQVASAFVAFTFGLFILSKTTPKDINKNNILYEDNNNNSINFFSEAKPFFLLNLIGMLLQLDILILGWLSSPYEAGLYQAATRIVTVIIFGLNAINMALMPRVAAEWASQNYTKVQSLASESVLFSVIIAISAAIFFFIFGEKLLSFFGNAFKEASNVLYILILGQLINAGAGSCGIILNMTGNQNISMKALAISSVVMIVGSIILVPHFGSVGAAISSAIAMILWNILLAYKVWQITGIRTDILLTLRTIKL